MKQELSDLIEAAAKEKYPPCYYGCPPGGIPTHDTNDEVREIFKEGASWFAQSPEALKLVGKSEWVEISNKPKDLQKCWFYMPLYDTVKYGTFYAQDSFKRANMFTSMDGAFFPIDHVSHYIPFDKPTPPINK